MRDASEVAEVGGCSRGISDIYSEVPVAWVESDGCLWEGHIDLDEVPFLEKTNTVDCAFSGIEEIIVVGM